MLENGETLPEGVNFENKFIYYVGPVDPVREEVIGPSRSDNSDTDGQIYRLAARTYRTDRHDW